MADAQIQRDIIQAESDGATLASNLEQMLQ
jgi:hypothetical protein